MVSIWWELKCFWFHFLYVSISHTFWFHCIYSFILYTDVDGPWIWNDLSLFSYLTVCSLTYTKQNLKLHIVFRILPLDESAKCVFLVPLSEIPQSFKPSNSWLVLKSQLLSKFHMSHPWLILWFIERTFKNVCEHL